MRRPADLLKERSREEPFAKLLDMEVLEVKEGYSKVKMRIDESKLNIHGITHGGALFSLVDEAFEMASNSHGTVAVALNMNITFLLPTKKGDELISEAKEIKRTKRTATYLIEVKNQEGELVALCQALVYRKDKPLFDD